jgi:hypothetical protein
MTSPLNVGATGGGSVTISGLSFGSEVVTPTASLAVAEMCGSAAWTSATTVACAPMAYRGSALRTGTSVSAVAGTLTGQFSFDGIDAQTRYRASLVSRSCRLLQLRLLASVA